MIWATNDHTSQSPEHSCGTVPRVVANRSFQEKKGARFFETRLQQKVPRKKKSPTPYQRSMEYGLAEIHQRMKAMEKADPILFSRQSRNTSLTRKPKAKFIRTTQGSFVRSNRDGAHGFRTSSSLYAAQDDLQKLQNEREKLQNERDQIDKKLQIIKNIVKEQESKCTYKS